MLEHPQTRDGYWVAPKRTERKPEESLRGKTKRTQLESLAVVLSYYILQGVAMLI